MPVKQIEKPSVAERKMFLSPDQTNLLEETYPYYGTDQIFNLDETSLNILQKALFNVNKKSRLLSNGPSSNQSVYYNDQEALELASTIVNNYVKIMGQASAEYSNSDVGKYFTSERTVTSPTFTKLFNTTGEGKSN